MKKIPKTTFSLKNDLGNAADSTRSIKSLKIAADNFSTVEYQWKQYNGQLFPMEESKQLNVVATWKHIYITTFKADFYSC